MARFYFQCPSPFSPFFLQKMDPSQNLQIERAFYFTKNQRYSILFFSTSAQLFHPHDLKKSFLFIFSHFSSLHDSSLFLLPLLFFLLLFPTFINIFSFYFFILLFHNFLFFSCTIINFLIFTNYNLSSLCSLITFLHTKKMKHMNCDKLLSFSISYSDELYGRASYPDAIHSLATNYIILLFPKQIIIFFKLASIRTNLSLY